MLSSRCRNGLVHGSLKEESTSLCRRPFLCPGLQRATLQQTTSDLRIQLHIIRSSVMHLLNDFVSLEPLLFVCSLTRPDILSHNFPMLYCTRPVLTHKCQVCLCRGWLKKKSNFILSYYSAKLGTIIIIDYLHNVSYSHSIKKQKGIHKHPHYLVIGYISKIFHGSYSTLNMIIHHHVAQ